MKKGPKKEKAAKKQRSRLDDYVGPDDDDSEYDNFGRDSYAPVVAKHRKWREDDDSEEDEGDEDLPRSMKRKAVDVSTIKEPTLVNINYHNFCKNFSTRCDSVLLLCLE